MIKIGDKVRCVKEITLKEDVLVKEGAIGIVVEQCENTFSVKWIKGEYRPSKLEIWAADEEDIELINGFKDKSIQIDDDGILFWNEGNGDEIIGNVKYLDRDVLIDVIKTITEERDNLEMDNEDFREEIECLRDELDMKLGR